VVDGAGSNPDDIVQAVLWKFVQEVVNSVGLGIDIAEAIPFSSDLVQDVLFPCRFPAAGRSEGAEVPEPLGLVDSDFVDTHPVIFHPPEPDWRFRVVFVNVDEFVFHVPTHVPFVVLVTRPLATDL